jgi:hypothetical protein
LAISENGCRGIQVHPGQLEGYYYSPREELMSGDEEEMMDLGCDLEVELMELIDDLNGEKRKILCINFKVT